MKQILKETLFVLTILLLLPLTASADVVEISGIWYNLINKTETAEVTSSPNKYTGNVVIPESVIYNDVTYSVTGIGKSAFERCYNLTSVTIPNSVTNIGNSAFYVCSGLTSVTIPNSVTSIGEYAFGYCSGLTSVTIPSCVTCIREGAFRECSGLNSVTIGDNVTSIESLAFKDCSGLTSIIIPNSVTKIGYATFSGCTALTSVSIPNSVTSIGNSAFGGCTALASVTIGNGIQKVEGLAFAACPNLTNVTCYAENVPNTNTDAFKDSYVEYTTLQVPSNAIEAYKAVEPWKFFKSIEAIDGPTPGTQKCEKPTISYKNGQLKMSCVTEGAEFVTDITDADVKKHYDATISLTATYNISVYATKSGYENSDVATATLCWIDASPKTEGITDDITRISAYPVMVITDNGFIIVEGVEDRTNVSVYTTDGKQLGAAVSQNNRATIATSAQPGSIAVVKVGEKSIKIIVH